MYKIAVMGDYDSIYGFSSLGLDIYPTDGEEDEGKLLRRLADGTYGVIYVTEALAARVSEEIDRYRQGIMPIIIEIPGIKGNTGSGVQSVRKSVEQAVGSDILFSD